MTKKKKMLKRALLVSIICVSGLLGGCSSCSRMKKSLSSDMSGGLNRTVTVYDYNGDVIREWDGKFDISENDTKVYFDDQYGKRVIIYNAIVISEEH